MKFTSFFVVVGLVLAVAEPATAQTAPSKAALAMAGRQAPLKLIDYGNDYCDADTTVEEWLRALVGKHALNITWSGGRCVLVNDLRPGIDASSWPYCSQATVTLVHPKNKDDTPVIE